MHVENVHEVGLPKDPVIVVGGGELVARELAAREHHPAAETTAAPSRTRSDRGRTWSTKQLLRVIKMDWVDVDRHPCARKQVRIVRFARREHGWGGAGPRKKSESGSSPWLQTMRLVVLLLNASTLAPSLMVIRQAAGCQTSTERTTVP